MSNQQSDSARFPWMKAILSVVLCLAFVAGGMGAFQFLAAMKEPPPRRTRPEKVYAIEAFVVEQVDLQEIITAFGTTRPNREVVLDAQVAGEVVEVRGPLNAGGRVQGLKVGQKVAGPQIRASAAGTSERFAGDVLLRIDPASYQERYEQAQSRLNQDRAELKRLQQEQANNQRLLEKVESDYAIYKEQYERVLTLKQRGIATDSELATAKLELARYEEAKIQRENEQKLYPSRIELQEKIIRTHQTELELARLDLERTTIRPPFSGVISEVMVERGQFVNVGEPLVRLTDTSQVEIPLPLTLHDYARIERKLLAGQTPRVELSENQTTPTRWVGHVVRRAPEADAASRTIDVFVHVDNEGEENADQPIALLPSVFVHARVDGPVLKQTIVVPRDVIRDGKLFVVTNLKRVERDDNPADDAYEIATRSAASEVWEGIAEEREVTIERSIRDLSIVTAGVAPGEHVALTNLDVIHTGARIRIESRTTLGDTLKDQATPALRRPALAGGPPDDDRTAVSRP